MLERFSVFSVNPGIGLHLRSYENCGGDLRYAIERLAVPARSLTHNLHLANEGYDSRWFYNRREKGMAVLLNKIGLSKGELDLLDFTTHVRSPNDHRPQNLYDCFALVRGLMPKLFVGFVPLDFLQSKKFERCLKYVRRETSNGERDYMVIHRAPDTADFGAFVSRRFGLVLGIRSDIAAWNWIEVPADVDKFLFSPHRKIDGKPHSQVTDVCELSVKEQRFLSRLLAKHDPRLPRVFAALWGGEGSKLNAEDHEPDSKIWKRLGYKKKDRPHRGDQQTIAMSSPTRPVLLVDGAIPIETKQRRPFSKDELIRAFCVDDEWKLEGTYEAVWNQLLSTIPKEVTESLAETFITPLLTRSYVKELDAGVMRLEVDRERGLRSFVCDVDLGNEVAKTKIGESPLEADYDYVFDANEIDEDFIVYGPFDHGEGRRVIVGAIKRKQFDSDNRRRCISAIEKVKGGSDKRVRECPLTVPQSMIDMWEKQGTEYKVSADKRMFKRRTKPSGKWDLTWRSVSIPSSTVGWTRQKVTRVPQRTKLLVEDPVTRLSFWHLNTEAEFAYQHLAPGDYEKQKTFVEKWIGRERTISPVFTTMAVNRYGNEMPAMNYHADAGDENSGLTTVTVFDQGYYEGGLFVLPRYRCAFRIGDGDVFVANSREVHGVSAIEGDGRRLSVVSYAKTDLSVANDPQPDSKVA